MSHFFALLRRMRHIRRWSLMRSTMPENIAEHTLEVAWIAHQLAEMDRVRRGIEIDTGTVVLLALYHEVSEIFTGDLPTPIKYFDPELRRLYGEVESAAQRKMHATLPEEMQSIYRPYLQSPEEHPLYSYVKKADTLSAYMQCLVEVETGNREFAEAKRHIEERLEAMACPLVDEFRATYLPSLLVSLDDLGGGLYAPVETE